MLTPEEAHSRIRQGAKNRHDPRTYARSIVKKWPALDENARAELRDILSHLRHQPIPKTAEERLAELEARLVGAAPQG